MGDGSQGRGEFDDGIGCLHDEIEGLFDALVLDDDPAPTKLLARIPPRRRRRMSSRKVMFAAVVSVLVLASTQLLRHRHRHHPRRTGGERISRAPTKRAPAPPRRIARAPRRQGKARRGTAQAAPHAARRARVITTPRSEPKAVRPARGPASRSRKPTSRSTPSKAAREFGFER
jgi:hypothetical protein